MDQQRIDEKVTQYVLDNGKTPRFVLLDKASFNRFTQVLKPKERISIAVDDFHKVCRMCCSADCWVDVLSVDVDRTLFEVTG
jgi:hypothetical protein